MKLAADANEIRRALGLLYPPTPWDFCVELRVPNTSVGTIAGYFNDPEKLLTWAASICKPKPPYSGPLGAGR
jgi:hypothetical protein